MNVGNVPAVVPGLLPFPAVNSTKNSEFNVTHISPPFFPSQNGIVEKDLTRLKMLFSEIEVSGFASGAAEVTVSMLLLVFVVCCLQTRAIKVTNSLI